MSFFRFLRDRIPAVLIYTAVTALAVIFLYATRCGNTAVAVTILLYVLSGAIILLWDYFRRRSFYARTISALDELEQKYLISEMLPDADFADGEILCELMTETCRSMYENVAAHKRSSDDFREFIELWVHEIKLPVAALLLMCHNDGDKAAEYREQIKRIDDCIENVLFYTRSENAEKDYIIKDVLLSRAFNAAATKNISALRKRGVSIETDGLDTAVMTDGKWLEYILGQFMSNSLKYFSPDREPEIKVTAEEFPDRTELHFHDNGCGIQQSDLPYIFEKSFTGSNGREGSHSTGMGLYIVHNLCKRLGHSIKADSVQGEYTELIISFGRNDFAKPI